MRIQAEVDSVAEDLNAGLADYVAGGFGVATGVNQVAGRQAEDGAVGEGRSTSLALRVRASRR